MAAARPARYTEALPPVRQGATARSVEHRSYHKRLRQGWQPGRIAGRPLARLLEQGPLAAQPAPQVGVEPG